MQCLGITMMLAAGNLLLAVGIAAFSTQPPEAFSPRHGGINTNAWRCKDNVVSFRRAPLQVSVQSSAGKNQESLPVASMRIRDIQAELRNRRVSYEDCFDKESLVKRLQEARELGVTQQSYQQATTNYNGNSNGNNNNNNNNNKSSYSTYDDGEIIPEVMEKGEKPNDYTRNDGSTIESEFDTQSNLAELRDMSVRSLREECAKRKIRWAQFIEKEDIVQALLKARSQTVRYAVAGHVQPGLVADLTADQLLAELSQNSEAPLLLDIYATWCGPCQMMAPQLQDAAFELGTRVRVAKLDSDQYPEMAQKFGAKGLPTVLLLNGADELSRAEGAMMKESILNFVNPFMQ
jgi:thioredoxin 1